MTDKRQEEAQKIAEEIVKNVVRSRKSFPSQRIASDLEDLIEQALINYASKERGNLIKFIKDLDPFLADCDWEDSDDVAYAVQKFIVRSLRDGE